MKCGRINGTSTGASQDLHDHVNEMSSVSASTTFNLNETERRMFAHLSQFEPELCQLWLQELPASRESIKMDLQAALKREGIQEGAKRIMGLHPDWNKLRMELVDSATNLALSRALVNRRGRQLRERFPACKTLLSALEEMCSPSDIAIELDSLNAEGHPLHPCRRTKLGFSPADALSFTPEAGKCVPAKIVAVRFDHVVQSDDSFAEVLQLHYPFIVDAATEALRRRGYDAGQFQFSVTHAFQFINVIPQIFKEEIANGVIVLLPEVTMAGRPTSSTRTLAMTAPGVLGRRLAIKTAIDVQITSLVRTISPESVRNGPYISALLTRLLAGNTRVSCVAERCGIAFADKCENGFRSAPEQRARDEGLSSILRDDIAEHAAPDEVIIGCAALTTVSPISGQPLLIELVKSSDDNVSYAAAANFLDTYTDLLLSGTLPLLWRYGISLEAHLQNTLLVLKQNKPTKLLLQDFDGILIHLGRLVEAGESIGDIPCLDVKKNITNDVDKVFNHFAHSVIFTNLMQVVKTLASCNSLTLAEDKAWSIIHRRIVKTHAHFKKTFDPRSNAILYAAEHLNHLLHSPKLPQKALVTMRLLSMFDNRRYYCLQANPLYKLTSFN